MDPIKWNYLCHPPFPYWFVISTFILKPFCPNHFGLLIVMTICSFPSLNLFMLVFLRIPLFSFPSPIWILICSSLLFIEPSQLFHPMFLTVVITFQYSIRSLTSFLSTFYGVLCGGFLWSFYAYICSLWHQIMSVLSRYSNWFRRSWIILDLRQTSHVFLELFMNFTTRKDT